MAEVIDTPLPRVLWAIVTGKNDHRILVQARLLQELQNAPHVKVSLDDELTVGAAAPLTMKLRKGADRVVR